jgi:hypothetical protein
MDTKQFRKDPKEAEREWDERVHVAIKMTDMKENEMASPVARSVSS